MTSFSLPNSVLRLLFCFVFVFFFLCSFHTYPSHLPTATNLLFTRGLRSYRLSLPNIIHIQESVLEWLQQNGALCCCETLKFDILLQLISSGKKPPSNTSTAPVVAGAALGAAGFTSAGVAAGSIAAGVQSAVYGGSVAAGSLFALCQSAGAIGVIGSAATAAIGGGTGLTGIAATLGSFRLFVRHSYIFSITSGNFTNCKAGFKVIFGHFTVKRKTLSVMCARLIV